MTDASFSLVDTHIVITAGPTREWLDPVRFLTNISSGKMGYEVAAACQKAGARVTLVSGPSDLEAPEGVTLVPVDSADQMLHAVEEALPADVFIGVAAVADYRPATRAGQKMKKRDGEDELTLTLVKNPDILAHVGHHETLRPALVAGFALESEEMLLHAKEKLARKGADIIFANEVPENVAASHIALTFINKASAIHPWSPMTKQAAAAKIVETVSKHLPRHPNTNPEQEVA